MELVHQIEKMTEGWFKQMPHLPKGVRTWLGENAWWLVIIGVVIGAIGIFSGLALIIGASAVVGMMGMYGMGALVGVALTAAWVSLAFSAVTVIIEAMAIKPLQNKQKRGWDLVFLSLLLNVAASVISAVMLMNPFGLVMTALATLVGGYVMFEIRGEFAAHTKKK